MKKLLPAIALLFFLASCKISKDYLAHRNEDKTLYNIVKQLNKHADDQLATAALPEVYAQLQQTHLSNIETYNLSSALNRWDKIAGEYYILQDFYNGVINSSAASKLITAVNYQQQIEQTKTNAAAAYFQSGSDYLNTDTWQEARKAYAAFKKADQWIHNYKGAAAMMDTAKENSIVNVLINPVQDNSLYFNTSWNSNNTDYSSNNLPQNLVRELGGNAAGRYPARFYTGWQSQQAAVSPDWMVDLSLRDADIPGPTVYNYTRNVSRNIEIGKDSSGKAIYQKVQATLHIQRQSFNAKAQMDMNITETTTRKNILFNSFSDSYNWQQEVASYSGDSRALGDSDWNLINNRYNMPTKDEVLNELYRGIYPQVKNKISNAVDW